MNKIDYYVKPFFIQLFYCLFYLKFKHKKKKIKKRFYQNLLKYKFIKLYSIITIFFVNRQYYFNIYYYNNILSILLINYCNNFIYLVFLTFYLDFMINVILRPFILIKFTYFLLIFYIFLRYKNSYLSICLSYYERMTNQFIEKVFINFYNYNSFLKLPIFKYFSFKYSLFSIYKFSYGHSPLWLIKRINFLNNKSIKFLSLIQSHYLKYFDNWQYIKQYRFIVRFHSRKSILWKLKNYFGCFSPYIYNFWVYGDQFSSLYILKFTWIIKNI
jgi:hypothetical protein